MPERSELDFLRDIREAIERIARYTQHMSYDDFLEDTRTQDAVIRNLEIIGEATKNISESFGAEYADISWRSMARTRDRPIHGYFGVNVDIVWQIIQQELAPVAARLKQILDEE